MWLKPSRNLDTCQLWDYLYCFDLHLYNSYVLQAGDLQQIWIWGRACAQTQGMKNYNCFDKKKTEFRTSDFKYFKIGTNSTTKYSNICVEYLHDFISIHWNLNILQNKNITESK